MIGSGHRSCGGWFAGEQADDLNEELERLRGGHGLPALAAAVIPQGVIVASGAVGVRAYGSVAEVTIGDRFHPREGHDRDARRNDI